MDAADQDKHAAAIAAVAEVRPGMLVGLGTGSTAAHAVREIGRRVAEGLAIRAVATSDATERLARSLAIPILDFAEIDAVDLTIDGADEITPALQAIKGAGGAMVREKIVATASARMIVVADASKQVAALGRAALPVEVLPFARSFVAARLRALEAMVTLRMVGNAPYRSDQGNAVLDCHFATLADPAALARQLVAIPGVIGHGLFLDEIDAAYIAHGGAVTRLERDGND